MEAMIFAAGLGTRLQPITNSIPKALVEINGVCLLQLCIDNLIKHGCTKIVVNIHHFGEQIINFLNSNKFDVDIAISDERDCLLDTGGGLKKAEHLFDKKNPILIHNVDILSSIDLKELYTTHCQSNALATLAVAERKTSRYLLFDHHNNLAGWTNHNTGETLWAKKSDYNDITPMAFSGIHVVSPKIFDLLPDNSAYSIVPQYIDMASHEVIKAYPHSAKQWLDVGKHEALEKAKDFIVNLNII